MRRARRSSRTVESLRHLSALLALAALLGATGCGADGKDITGPGGNDAPQGDPSIQAKVNGVLCYSLADDSTLGDSRQATLTVEQPREVYGYRIPGRFAFYLSVHLLEATGLSGVRLPNLMQIDVSRVLNEPLASPVGLTFECGEVDYTGNGVCVPCAGDETGCAYMNPGTMTVTITGWDAETRRISGTFEFKYVDTDETDPGYSETIEVTEGKFSIVCEPAAATAGAPRPRS
jgi:hypothetical protein